MTENLDSNGGYRPNMSGVQLHDSSLLLRLLHPQPKTPGVSPSLPLLHTFLCSTTRAPRKNPELLPRAGTRGQAGRGDSVTPPPLSWQGRKVKQWLNVSFSAFNTFMTGFQVSYFLSPQKKPVTAVTAMNCNSSGMHYHIQIFTTAHKTKCK